MKTLYDINEEELVDALADRDIYSTIKTVIDDDCYVDDFLDSEVLEYFLTLMVTYNNFWITSDDRVLLTQKGENLLYRIASVVELTKKPAKIRTDKKLCKTKNQP